MKRTPLKRKTPLARTSRLPARRATPRRSERVEDSAYVASVHTLPCCARDLSPCDGPIEADHAGKKSGMGRKADDATCIPLCRDHHGQRHAFNGPFKSWTAPTLRRWLDGHIAATRATLSAADTTRSPGAVGTSSAKCAAGHLSRALEQLLPEPGAIAVGTPVVLGTREGSVSAVLPGGRVAVRWLDGEITDEALAGAITAAR